MLKNLEQFNLPEVEEQVLKFWKEHSIFKQSLAKNAGKKKFVFYEGPPTANGMPGLHHLLARSFKDIIPRFKAMQGFDVPRKAGWDTHGLPVELQAEKELGFTGKQDIEKYGIAEFNAKCRELVWRYKTEFETAITDRLGFWVDLEHPYITYDNTYIESLWWIIAQIEREKLLYEGHRIVPWCTRCGTALSSHELAQGYKEVEDTSVYVKFKLTGNSAKKIEKQIPRLPASGEARRYDGGEVYVLSWTTTPWTLPGNVALAVGDKIEYAVIRVGEENYILAKDRLGSVFPLATSYSLLATVRGSDLRGLQYEPLFDVKPLKSKKSYQIYPADFVTTTDGTGVVHTAVMYGEDDYALGLKLGLPQHHTVNEQGHFTKEVKPVADMYAKSGKAEKAILDSLATSNSLLATAPYKHEYPHCWRCGTALLYYARTSWFVAMSKLRTQLMASNKKINWIPKHIKEGRFGEWLKEVKDWNFSRERYWGTPLPVWWSKDHKQQIVVSSLADIKKYAVTNGNKFFGIRHGEATHNIEKKNGGGPETARLRSELTPAGATRVHAATRELKKLNIDLIVASPYYRAEQTADIIAKELKIKIITDKRLGEIDCGIYNWQSMDSYHKFFTTKNEQWVRAPEKGETWSDVRKRTVACIRDIEKKYKNKNILIVSHGDPLWILEGAMRGQSNEDFTSRNFYPGCAEPFEIEAPVLPFDGEGRLDVHRPYIDQIVLRDPKTKQELHRVKEVVDGWFDSGSMPWAQAHYPFATKEIDYPADYIAEGIDQTRGWFYTLLAVATTLGLPAPYKNVICLGLIHDKNGQKMSKSKGNIVNPMELMKKHGADVVRWYLYTINNPGDPKNFDENDLAKTMRRFFLILYNSFVFWNSYGRASGELVMRAPTNVLDKWIISRLHQLTADATKLLETYEVGKTAALIEQFTDDLSRWYIRRSRDRFQSSARGDSSQEDDYRQASATLHTVLLTLTKLTAPFIPFFSEAMYKSLDTGKVSVHLENWPTANTTEIDQELISDMALVREVATSALALRSTAGIKVRQPLQKITLKNKALKGKEELLQILLDEVNIKEVAFDATLAAEGGILLDTTITVALREEGLIRELTRAISGLRANAHYQMGEDIVLMIAGEEKLSDLIQRHSMQLKKAVNAKTIELKKSEKVDASIDTKIDDTAVWIGVRKI